MMMQRAKKMKYNAERRKKLSKLGKAMCLIKVISLCFSSVSHSKTLFDQDYVQILCNPFFIEESESV